MAEKMRFLAIAIQKRVRGINARKRLWGVRLEWCRRHQAASSLQRIYRGADSRRDVRQIRMLKRLRDMEAERLEQDRREVVPTVFHTHHAHVHLFVFCCCSYYCRIFFLLKLVSCCAGIGDYQPRLLLVVLVVVNPWMCAQAQQRLDRILLAQQDAAARVLQVC